MKGYIDNSMNFFLYLTIEEIDSLPKGLEGELFKYPTRTIVPFKIDSNFRNPSSADWKYSEGSNSKTDLSIGKSLQETLTETGKAYSRFNASMGAEIFIYDTSRLDFTQEMNLEQVEFNMNRINKNN